MDMWAEDRMVETTVAEQKEKKWKIWGQPKKPVEH